MTATNPQLTGRSYLHTAYLMSQYPAISHTFFLQEIVGLRSLGIKIHTASINPPDRPMASLSEAERAEAAKTYYLKGKSALLLLPAVLLIAITHPVAAMRGLVAAFKLEPWHFTHTIYALFYWAEALLLGDWMRRHRLTHLHIHFSGAVASVGMLTSIAWNIPYSLTVHGPDEFFDQNENALAQKVQNSAFLICISDFCKSQLMRISSPDTWDKLHVIRLGILPELAELPAPNEEGDKRDQVLKILCTGRLVGAKGQAVLLLAIAALKQRGHHVRATFIGHGRDHAVLEKLVDETDTRDSVIFAGAQSHDQVLEQLRNSDLFVLPSFAEGVPVALMEAMAMGVPCISTFIAGIPELIRHEIDGLLVPAGSLEGLTDAIERLIQHPEERQQFRSSAREHVLTHYNLPVNLEKLASAFTALAPYALRSSDE